MLRRAVSFLTILVAISIFVTGPVNGQNTTPLQVERAVSPQQGQLQKDEFVVEFTLTGNSASCPQLPPLLKSDIVLVMDRSGSMAGERLAALKRASKLFLTRVNFANDQVALVEFAGAAFTSQNFTTNAAALAASIDAIGNDGGTNIAEGVEFANREFDSGRARKDANRILVVLSDGEDNSPRVTEKAEESRLRGIRIIAVALGDEAGKGTLRGIASQPSDFYDAPNPADLDRIYGNLATTFRQPIAATDILLEHTYDATSFEVVPNSITSGGQLSGDKITWKLSNVLSRAQKLSYRVRARSPGRNVQIDRGDVVQFKSCATTPVVNRLPPALPVTVDSPPTSTPIPQGTVLPTPAVTFTPALPPIGGGTPPPTPPNRGPSMLAFLCDLPWLPWLIGILALLAFLWALYRLWREFRKPALADRSCKQALWLLLPLLLLLLGSLLSILAGSACLSRESVYFWKIPQSGLFSSSTGRIFVTDKEGARPAREFDAVAPGTCTGCHSVSSASNRLAAVAGGGSGPLVVYTLDGRSVSVPTVRGSFSAWSPDGKKIAFTTEAMDIVVVDVDKGTVTPLAGASDPTVGEAMPAWTADGSAIAFARGQTHSTPFTFDGPTDIFIVPAIGGAAQPFPGASGNGMNYYPAFSPDGKWMAFTRHTRGSTTYAAPEAEIFTVAANGGTPIRIKANDATDGRALVDVSNSWTTWSLDGKQLAFTSKRDDPRYDVFLASIDNTSGDSGSAKPLTTAAIKGEFEHLPFWGVPPEIDPVPAILGLWPWLIPLLLVLLLARLLCRLWREPPIPDPDLNQVPRIPPNPIPAIMPKPLWQVAPTLFVGVGGSGRWVLTHLKKTLRDAGGGELPKGVRFLLLDTSERETTNVFRDAFNAVENVSFAGVSLQPDEVLLINNNLADTIRAAGEAGDNALTGWFPHDEARHWSEEQKDLSHGTFGRRPMARAGLISQLRMPDTADADVRDGAKVLARGASALWRTLVEGSRGALDGNLVRVVITGSTAGGMSGVLCDVAYLARQAAATIVGPRGTTQVDGYLAGHGAFLNAGETVNREKLQQASAATLRELQRFQLAQNYIFPMSYTPDGKTDSDRPHLEGQCNWMLFDYLSMFGRREQFTPGRSNEPWATTFAAISDVIAQRLDRAALAGGLGAARAALRSDVITKQTGTGQAVVSGAGSYSYRVPVMDILELAQSQWARKLFYVFMNGSLEEKRPSFDPTLAGLKDTPEQAARKLLTGRFGVPDAPNHLHALDGMMTGEEYSPWVVSFARASSGEETFGPYLSGALQIILNGTSDETDLTLRRRAPRLGYAREFVRQTQTLLQTMLTTAQTKAESAKDGSTTRGWLGELSMRLGGGPVMRAEWQTIVDRLTTWVTFLKHAADTLAAQVSALEGSATTSSVFGELDRLQIQAEARQRQMDQVAVRTYLWRRPGSVAPQTLAGEIFQRADANLSAYLTRLSWRVLESGQVQLSIVSDARKIVLDGKNADSAAKIVDELMRLASHVVREAAGSLTLSDVFASQLDPALSDPVVALAEQTWRHAQPHLVPPLGLSGGMDGVAGAAASIPDENNPQSFLARVAAVFRTAGSTPENRIQSNLEPVATRAIAGTDPTALTLVREYALMPMRNLPENQSALTAYCDNAGTDRKAGTEPTVSTPVFAVERLALDYERRLESPTTNIDFHVLHPLVVLALSQPDAARGYAAAYAAGWVQAGGGRVALVLPGASPIDLGVAPAGLPPEIAGLLSIAQRDDAKQDQVNRLVVALDDPANKTNLRNAWRAYIERFVGSGARPFAREPQSLQDLAAFAALEAYRRLVVAIPNASHWDAAIPKKMRNCRS